MNGTERVGLIYASKELNGSAELIRLRYFVGKRPAKVETKRFLEREREILSSPCCPCNRCGVDSSYQLSHPSLSRLPNTNLGSTVYLFAAIWSLIMTLPPTTRLRLPPFYIYRPPSQQHLQPTNCAVLLPPSHSTHPSIQPSIPLLYPFFSLFCIHSLSTLSLHPPLPVIQHSTSN